MALAYALANILFWLTHILMPMPSAFVRYTRSLDMPPRMLQSTAVQPPDYGPADAGEHSGAAGVLLPLSTPSLIIIFTLIRNYDSIGITGMNFRRTPFIGADVRHCRRSFATTFCVLAGSAEAINVVSQRHFQRPPQIEIQITGVKISMASIRTSISE